MQLQPVEEQRLKPLRHPLDPSVCQKAARYAVRVAEEMSKRSVLLLSEGGGPDYAASAVKEYRREEILPHLGEMLGKGGFNNVFELDYKSFAACHPTAAAAAGSSSSNNHHASGNNHNGVQLAVKFLSDDAMYSPEDFCNGAADLLMEAKYLTALAAHPHPSLIQLHGVCAAGPAGFKHPERAGFFLILDRLYDTLDRRIDVWKDLKRRKRAVHSSHKVMQALWMQRLLVAQDIASALVHLHHLNIIFRDLKPDNVGFDFSGRVKLFDFGLAKELDPQQKQESTGLYQMSGGTGSRRFMAPEVAMSEPYHLSADMYSFSVLTWELLTLDKAFGHMSVEEHRERVVHKNERLPLDPVWSNTVVEILEGCWTRHPKNRWSARDVHKKLKQEVHAVYQETFVATKNKHQDQDEDRRMSY